MRGPWRLVDRFTQAPEAVPDEGEERKRGEREEEEEKRGC